MKSYAPSFIAVTASSTEPYAVIRMTGMVGSACFVSRSTSRPEHPGSFRSVRTSKYLRARTFATAEEPSGASSTLCPPRSSALRNIARSSGLSSTRRRGSIELCSTMFLRRAGARPRNLVRCPLSGAVAGTHRKNDLEKFDWTTEPGWPTQARRPPVAVGPQGRRWPVCRLQPRLSCHQSATWCQSGPAGCIVAASPGSGRCNTAAASDCNRAAERRVRAHRPPVSFGHRRTLAANNLHPFRRISCHRLRRPYRLLLGSYPCRQPVSCPYPLYPPSRLTPDQRVAPGLRPRRKSCP